MTTTPATIPSGLRVELLRGRIRPGREASAQDWMRMLNDRAEECVATLDRERMALEAVFWLRERERDWLYWVCVRGPDGAESDPSIAIDRDHLEFSREVLEPGWTRADPQLLLMPPPLDAAVRSWSIR